MLFTSSTKSLLVAWFGAGASKGSPPAHRAEKSSHPSPSAPLAAPQGPLQQLHSHQQPCCTEKQSLSPFMFPFSSSSFIPQPLPAAKSSPFPSWLAFGELTVLVKLQKNTQLVLQGRVFCHLSEQICCKMGSKEPSGHEARALMSQAAGLG